VSDGYDFFIAVNTQKTGEYVVKVNGAIDMGNAARLQEALLDGIIGTPTKLIVDVASVRAIDPSGLDVLVGAHRRATAAGTQLVFRHPNAEVAHLLEQNGLPSATALEAPAGVPGAVLRVLREVSNRDPTVPMAVAGTGIAGEVSDELNEIKASIEQFEGELARVSWVVGKEGRHDQRMHGGFRSRTFDGCVESVNDLIRDLTDHARRLAAAPTLRVGHPWELTAADHGEPANPVTVDEREAHAEALQYQTLHDPLTALPNRALFNDRLRQAILVAGRDTRPMAVLIVDVDDFKQVNDALGQDYGDALLKAIAVRLTAALREPDTVARVGGDEFAILPGGSTDLDGAAGVACKVMQALEPAFVIRGRTLETRASIGISLFPAHGSNPAALLRRADLAMRDAKRSKSGFAVFSAVQEEGTAGRLKLVSELRHCIDRDQLVLHYQPKVDLANRRILGVEALVRWRHPTDGLLAPDLWVPLIERIGLIAPMTRWVLNEAFHQLRLWRDAGLDFTMSVNLSTRSLETFDIVDMVAELSETWAVPPQRMTLEITEGALINAAASAVLERFHDMGEQLSIDDFGTGYSSLAYVQRLPVDEVKIDKSFVIDLATGDDNATIVRSIIDLGHNLGLTVCAEGVEDEIAQAMLIDYGCDNAQGYLISRPLPAEDLLAWLAESPWDLPSDGRRYHPSNAVLAITPRPVVTAHRATPSGEPAGSAGLRRPSSDLGLLRTRRADR
jgi:anti-anti-sigma factor